MNANRGFFEPTLQPSPEPAAPALHGIARLIAAQESHREDLARLPGREEESMPARRARTAFIADTARFVEKCAAAGAGWDETWEQVQIAARVSAVQLTVDDEERLLEKWIVTKPQEAAA